MNEITVKRFDPKSNRFFIISRDDEGVEKRRVFFTLESFVEALGNNIEGADLSEYPSNSPMLVDLEKKGAIIPRHDSLSCINSVVKSHLLRNISLDCMIYYITDIHLDEKIMCNVRPRTDENVERYVESTVREMCKDQGLFLASNIMRTVILVGGDVSHDSRTVEIFYKNLRKNAPYTPIIAVLGNHEVWDQKTFGPGPSNIEASIDYYRNMLRYHGVCTLERSLVSFKYGQQFRLMDEHELISASIEDIRKFTAGSLITIFGGMGFAALDPMFKADYGIYKNALISVEYERELSEKTSKLYSKLREAIPDEKVVVLTHMPLENWTGDGHQAGWIYISGHNHSNTLDTNRGYQALLDGQIGYAGKPAFKSFFLEWENEDIFIDRPDGEYRIPANEYRRFYFRKGIYMQSKMTTDVIMIKRKGLYCFFVESDKGRLYMLDGGAKKKTNHDLSYYCNNLVRFSEVVHQFFEQYYEALKAISSDVKAIGGTGRIHGCIVDIDFFDHIYLNPIDGKVTPYYALNIVDKTVYASVEDLLKDRNPSMYQSYELKIGQGDITALAKPDKSDHKPAIKYYGTDIYRISKLIYKFQRMEEYLIVRTWNDAVLELPEFDSIRNFARCLIDPEFKSLPDDHPVRKSR